MISKEINIDVFDWNIRVIEIESFKTREIKLIENFLKDVSEDKVIKDFISSLIEKKEVDGGIYFRVYNKDSIIIMHPITKKSKRIEILSHEIYHCVRDISTQLELDSEETEAYLMGFITLKII
jgi:Zn-dependent peptidase ImmA (M78 family)